MGQSGSLLTDQAERSSSNPLGADTQMRILIELQVISTLLHDQTKAGDDLVNMRKSISDSMASY